MTSLKGVGIPVKLLHEAEGHVVSVDCNPAQSSLLELKKAAISQCSYDDVWAMFGEGRCGGRGGGWARGARLLWGCAGSLDGPPGLP